MTWGRLPENPFVGLRPFESDENLLFFGREEQVSALLKRLHHTGFVAVVGSSGSGKSSLVRAGLIPKLEAGFLVADRDRWHVAIMKPGGAPLTSLAEAVLSLQPKEDGLPGVANLRKAIDLSGVRAVRQTLAPLLEDTNANLLLLVDQFEEIFRFRDLRVNDAQHEEAADFVKIMLDLAERSELPVYVVMTMRSDFLGDCDIFHGLPEALNRSQYLVPRLTRRQLRTAIEGPIHLYGGGITRTLVDRYLNDAGRGHDQLPVIQHALNRTWVRWHREGAREGSLDVEHYEAVGTLDHALDWHAEKAYAELGVEGEEPSRKQVICEKIFKALTDKGPEARGVRRPTKLGVLGALAEASEAEVIEVIDVFRKPSRSFLMPPISTDMTAETVIDISHESLMRVWERLIKWVDDEALSGRIYSSLAERGELFEKGYESLLRDPQLQRALDWRAEDRPSEVWARRYDPDASPRFGRTMAYLDDSAAERERLAETREAERLREVEREKELAAERARAEQAQALAEAQAQSARRFRIGFVVGVVFALLASVAAVVAINSFSEAERQRKTAEAARVDADLSAEVARHEKAAAELQKQIAEAAHVDADTSAARAQRDQAAAERQEQIAEAARVDADTSAARAQRDQAEAERQKRLAEVNEDEALRQAGIAARARQQTVGVTLASAARQQQANGQAKLGALLARQAFLLNPETTGGEALNEVYDALSQSLKALGAPPSQSITPPGNAAVRAVAYSPQGLMASGGDDGNAFLWSTNASQGLSLSGSGRIQRMAFRPDGKVLAILNTDQTLRLWHDLDTGSPVVTTLSDYQGRVQAVAYSPDGLYFAAGDDDNTIHFLRLRTGVETPLGLPGQTRACLQTQFGDYPQLRDPLTRWYFEGIQSPDAVIAWFRAVILEFADTP